MPITTGSRLMMNLISKAAKAKDAKSVRGIAAAGLIGVYQA